MKINFKIRDFMYSDTEAVNGVALEAFEEYKHAYADWPAFSRTVGKMSSLAEHGEIIVATIEGKIVGAVAYIGPGKQKSDIFNVEWPVIRMLVALPQSRGKGIGRALTEECIRRAQRDSSPIIALHTTPLMKVALAMYLRMGFVFLTQTEEIYNVPYGIYIKTLTTDHEGSNRYDTARLSKI